MNTMQYASEESLGFMTFTAHRLLASTLRRRMKEAGIDLTSEQWGVLVLLWGRGSATQDELAQAACVDKSSMSRVLSLMEDRGLVTRRTDPDNERRKLICAAEGSLALRERGFAVAGGALQSALEGVTPDEAAVCMKVLAAIKNNLSTSR